MHGFNAHPDALVASVNLPALILTVDALAFLAAEDPHFPVPAREFRPHLEGLLGAAIARQRRVYGTLRVTVENRHRLPETLSEAYQDAQDGLRDAAQWHHDRYFHRALWSAVDRALSQRLTAIAQGG